MSSKKYLEKTVLEAARERISLIFDNFKTIIVSISGGKDSTVLAHLALTEAHKRGRKIGIFFLDEEVIYDATVKQVEYVMSLFPENTMRYWFQFEFNLTNSVDLGDGQFHCWDPAERPRWMHKRHVNNILEKPWSFKTHVADKAKGFGFYDVFENWERTFENAAFLVGLRADESLNRYRTMIKNPGWNGLMWSTVKGKNWSFYPIYDWSFADVWKYIGEEGLKYHAYYDYAFKKGVPPHAMRVSSLLHEKSFKSVTELPEFEPKTYDRLLKRAKGISFAQETARNSKMFKCRKLPDAYKTWAEYRDFLLATYPDVDKKRIFERRFANHLENEYVARQQVRQLVCNDYENNLPVTNTEDPVTEAVKFWERIL